MSPVAEPAVGRNGRGGRVGPVEVAGEQVRPAHLDLAHGRRRRCASPSSSTSRSSTPGSGAPDRARARGSPSARAPVFISVSVMPYRSTTRRPGQPRAMPLVVDARAARRSRRRAAAPGRAAAAAAGSVASVVGEPVVHGRDAEEHRRAGVDRRGDAPRARTARGGAPRRRGAAARACRAPARARGTAAGRAPARRRPVHSQASASASRWPRSPGAGSTAPLGGPVVPEV